MTTTNKTRVSPLDQVNAFTRNTEVANQLRQKALEKHHALETKYASIDSMDRHQKMETLSHPNINPFYLKDPYDGLSASLNRWKAVANDAFMDHTSGKLSQEQMDGIAGKYYDAMIKPFYDKMDKPPMDRNLWIKQAFREATQYDIKNAYDNTYLHNLKTNWNNGIPALARMGESVYNIVTNVLASPQQHTDDEYSHWHKAAKDATSTPASFTDARNPNSIVNIGSRRVQEEHQFWADALPSTGSWQAKATGAIAEQAAQLPAYIAMAAVPGVGAENLTARLGLSTVGKKTLQYLLAFGEGTSYGTLTRPKGDKHNSWQDGLGFMIGNMSFDVALAGLAKGAKVSGLDKAFRRTTLADMIGMEKGPNSAEFAAMKRRQDARELAIHGKEPVGKFEQREQFKKEAVSNMAVVGVEGQMKILEAAVTHLRSLDINIRDDKWTYKEIQSAEAEYMKEDPARWSPILAAANLLRHELSGKSISSLGLDSPEYKDLIKSVARLYSEAAGEMAQHVPEVAAQGAAKAVEENAKGAGGKTLEYFKAQVMKEAQETGASALMTPEQLDKMAKNRWAESVAKARSEASSEITTNRGKDARQASRAMASAEAPLPPGLRGSKPRYSFGVGNNFELTFDDPRDMAAYILTNKGRSAAHEQFMEYYKKYFPEMDGNSLAKHGQRIREYLKDQAKSFAGEKPQLNVPRMFEKPETAAAIAIKDNPSLKVRSARMTASPKDIFVRYSVTPSYKVYLEKAAKGAGIPSINSKDFSEWLSEHYNGMEDQDFAQHLQDNFYPKSLQQAEIWFERQWTKPIGPEFPNFLAFMYNYKDQMPMEMEQELEERLIGTAKFQAAFKGGASTQPILDYYSNAMYNHVDNFLGSGRWPAETNIFRTSSNNVRNTTKYQKDLLFEKMKQEQKILKDSFGKNPEASKVALKHLVDLQTQRVKAFITSYDQDPNSQATARELNELITGELTKSGKYDRWSF